MKIALKILVVLTIIVCLSGCSGTLGLDEQLIVYGIGVDKIDNKYEITVQFLDVRDSSEKNNKTQKTAIFLSAQGNDLGEAVNNIENMSGKKILYSHDLILVIGKMTAEKGIQDIINFFSTSHKLRPSVEVLVSNVSAKNVLSLKNDEKFVKAEDILSIIKLNYTNSNKIDSNILNLYGKSEITDKNVKVWYIELNENNEISCKKIGLLKNNYLIGILDEKSTEGMSLICENNANVSNLIQNNTENISCSIEKVKTNVNTKVINNNLIVFINVNADANFYNNVNCDGNIKLKICEQLKKLMHDSINICIKKHECDIFGFTKRIINKNVKYFKFNSNRINDVLKNAEYKINVNLNFMNLKQKNNCVNL